MSKFKEFKEALKDKEYRETVVSNIAGSVSIALGKKGFTENQELIKICKEGAESFLRNFELK